jgi:hypothetical protein
MALTRTLDKVCISGKLLRHIIINVYNGFKLMEIPLI